MPNILIELLEGRSDQQKRDLVRSITRSVVDTLACDPQTVNIRIYELKRSAVARAGRFLSEPESSG